MKYKLHFEHHTEPLLPTKKWLRRVVHSFGLVGTIAGAALCVGILGYHFIGGLDWIDALLEASMILGGMGPVALPYNDAVKPFAAFYALMSGLVIISSAGILLAPWLHRIMHKLHIQK